MPKLEVFESSLISDVQRLQGYFEHIKSYREYLIKQHEAYKVFHNSTRAQIAIRKKPLIIEYVKGVKMGLIAVDSVPNPRYE